MRIPDSLAPLFDYGILDDVVRPLMSGKEAQVYLVVSGGKYCVAKVYKDAQSRSFKHRAEYTEGRKVRNSRDQRAIQKRSKHGRAQDEAAWRSTEVDMIHRLYAAGVRVPTPIAFVEGVLVMELIVDGDGNPAPRLADLMFDPAAAQAMYERLLRDVVKMLCAGVVHGDLSDFNVLVGADGPVIIDFPQSVDTAHNTNARRLLLRDVENLHRFVGQFAPRVRRLPYAEEMWDLFQQNALTPETRLTGRYRPSERRANTHAVLELIQDANHDERKRRESLGQRGGGPPRKPSPRPVPPRSAGPRSVEVIHRRPVPR
jgi:RIO kinase 1